MVHKGQKGAKKWIYNKADSTGIFIALYLADILVKHGQVNPYTDGYSKRWQDIGFPLPGVSLKQGIFPIHSRGFCLQMGTGGFSL